VIAGMARRHAPPATEPIRVLDLGLGTAADLMNVRDALAPTTCELIGLESHAPYIEAARAKGITVHEADLERGPFPLEDGSAHVVVANQVLEHTKEIFWIASEVSRVLKPGGVFIAGLPNLASLHSRVMLALGMQPSPIEVLGPHVRGFTRAGFRRFIETGGFFEVLETKGSNFYPFPKAIAAPLAALFPSLAVSVFFACRRTDNPGLFIEVLKARFFETAYRDGTGDGPCPIAR